MRNLFITVLAVITVTSFTACYDRDIADLKAFDHSLPKVENLKYTKQGAELVQITWNIPANISPAFRTPLEVSIQKVENDVYREIVIVGGGATSRDIPVTPNKSYKFVVKLAGYLTDDAREKGKPDRVYSEAQIIEIQL